MNRQPELSQFSPHLFWDTDRSTLSWDKHRSFIIGRVLTHGLLDDWKLLTNYMTIDEIADEASNLRVLDAKSLNFIAVVSNRSLKSFRCYNLRESGQTL